MFTAATPAVTVGNDVSARGTVGEFFTLTQLESSLPGDVDRHGAERRRFRRRSTLTTTILDPAGTPDQLERFEGMRVSRGVRDVGRADERVRRDRERVLTGVARPLREPGISVLAPVPPDPTTGTSDCCIPRFDENPERIVIDSDGLAGASRLAVTSNVALSNVTGPARLHVRRLQAAAAGAAGGGREHEWRRRTAPARGRVHGRRLQHRELRGQRCAGSERRRWRSAS